MPKVNRSCERCGDFFDAEESEVKRGRGRFCGLSCSSSRLRPSGRRRSSVECAYCKKKFEKTYSQKKKSKSGLFFCTRSHKDAAQRIGGIREIMPGHYGTTLTRYRVKALREISVVCNRCGYDEEKRILVVHHKNHDREDNDISNLEILCPNCHAIHHIVGMDLGGS